MKRFFYLVVPMLLSSSAHAGSSLSFSIGGHRIHIEVSRHCRSPSCLSVSIPGIYETRRWRNRDDDRDEAAAAKPVAAPPPQQASAPAPVAPAIKPSVQPVVSQSVVSQPVALAPAPATVTLASSTTRVVAPPPTPVEAATTASTTPKATGSIIVMPAPPPVVTPPAPSPIAALTVAAPPVPVAAPPPLKVAHEADDALPATPLGDWQTEGKKGSVRIEPCGHLLCGYIIDPASNAAGETLLVNMKPKASDKTASNETASEKADTEWSGNIFSRDSGNTYYATMTMKSPNSLRVEACALGRFFCSGNLWTRIAVQPDKLVTSRQLSPAPPS
ncbi:Uncharacterized conserved protein, DUF2147 family [Bradyrhizobium lablabi]|uniref:Uncharacterized conserved protein, DUF2147 family n=1 Tax=Bradyrhizobium lablabi TaxID=722472 RepID=A0A1M6P924_9BRAD|nr:DUF2147 domain-containing protein [Bradyrhizobium lablabi]SHK04372.1 Uncharacterized conserved protein, DUF2147 family [Bradyrhizobium lablabi]